MNIFETVKLLMLTFYFQMYSNLMRNMRKMSRNTKHLARKFWGPMLSQERRMALRRVAAKNPKKRQKESRKG